MKTKNHDLIKEAIETTEMLYYYNNKAQTLLHQLNSIELTRTEKENYADLLEELESFTY
jgi:hypothetical protein